MELHVKELRIGNYTFKRLKSGNGRKNECKLNLNDLIKIQEDKLFIYEPIPLTEEWLLKFGFDIEEGKFGNEYHLRAFVLFTSKSLSISFVWDIFMKEIKYVHQLQNLYFALCGEELQLQ